MSTAPKCSMLPPNSTSETGLGQSRCSVAKLLPAEATVKFLTTYSSHRRLTTGSANVDAQSEMTSRQPAHRAVGSARQSPDRSGLGLLTFSEGAHEWVAHETGGGVKHTLIARRAVRARVRLSQA